MELDKNKRYLLACSHGPDSMALFHMLLTGGYLFEVAHVNYHLRQESDNEMNALIDYCEQHKIVFHIKSVTSIGDKNIEATCREIRYSFFEEIIRNRNLDAVLVAHNEDDLIETFYLQKYRKNAPIHYGINQKTILNNVCIIRPLLSISKQNLLEYCQKNSVPYSIDQSNFLDIYERNKIRHRIVEKMTKEEREKCLQVIKEENDKLQSIFSTLNCVDINSVSVLKTLDDIIFNYAINRLYSEVDSSKNLSAKTCYELRKVLISSKPNVSVPISGDTVFIKAYDRCGFSTKSYQKDYLYVLDAPGLLDTPFFRIDFRKNSSNRNVCEKDYPLTIRSGKLDDKYLIDDYKVSLRRLFIDWKMPTHIRQTWPVVLNKDGVIIYIPRYHSDFVKSDDLNFIVKIQSF